MTASPILSFADFRIDAPNGRLWRGSEPVSVPPKVLSVLHHLAERPQQLVTKADLFSHVWPETVVGDAVLTVAIGEIRKLLGDDPRTPRFIETVHRRGYRFIASVRNDAPTRAEDAAPRTDLRAAPAAGATTWLVGRDHERTALDAVLDRMLAGERQVVFLTGAPGLGKTTLVDAFLEDVAARGNVRIAKGQCLEHYGAGEAYLPMFEALATLAQEIDPDEFVPLLRRYAPSWLAQMPKLIEEDDFLTLLRTTAGIAPERRLREMLDALDELAARAPLVLVLEDLHWSDHSTIDLLAALARRRGATRLLVVGTYRPADLISVGHPLAAVTQELLARRQCSEIALDELAATSVAAYLDERFPRNAFPAALATLLHERTDGNPLFMVHLVDEWLAAGHLVDGERSWCLTRAPDDLRDELPHTLRTLIEQHVARTAADEQQLAAAASVIGDEFAVGPLAAALQEDAVAVERRCEALVVRDVLERRGVDRTPDGTLTSRYGFRHALCRNVLYERIPIGQRQQWHRRVAREIELWHASNPEAVAAELALHFEQGRDDRSAVRYLALAAQTAILRSAHREALGYLTRALAAAASLPDGSERDRTELVLRVALGVALSATQGYAAREVEETYTRALDLCRRVGGSDEAFSTLHGLCRFYGVRADFAVAIEVGDELYRHADERQDPAMLLEASWAKGTMLVYRGELAAARRLLEQGLAIYVPREHGAHAHVYGQDPAVACHAYLSWIALVTGSPDRAIRQAEAAVALARDLAHPFTLAFALHHAALTHQQRGDGAATTRLVDELLALANQEQFPFWSTMASIAQGGQTMRDGRTDDGLAAIEQGIALHRMFGADIGSTYWLALLAETHARRGARDRALTVVDEALALVESGQERLWEAELHRLKGDVLLDAFVSEPLRAPAERAAQDAAGACFARALQIAEAQDARLWALRAATRLAALWSGQRKKKRALELLVPALDAFSEGFDAPDLLAASALRARLES
jgi:DNA-binding winged helix-turn-helix (wHTH) protein/predicted ATPase